MQTLTRNQQIVFDIINKSSEPLKAYTILSNVQKKGIKAPPQVYRALDKLIEMGKIHKIESKNAFVACQNSSCNISKATAFSICESCEEVTEIDNSKISKMDLHFFSFSRNTSYKFKYISIKYIFSWFGCCRLDGGRIYK